MGVLLLVIYPIKHYVLDKNFLLTELKDDESISCKKMYVQTITSEKWIAMTMSYLFFWNTSRASISFSKGKARAAGIIWQRISWTGACNETAKFKPGTSFWSLLIAWITPTYNSQCKSSNAHIHEFISSFNSFMQKTSTNKTLKVFSNI